MISACMPAIVTAAEAAQLLQCSVKTVEERLREGDLPGEKFGDGWILPTQALIERVNEIAVAKMLERRKGRAEPRAPQLVAVGGRGRRAPPALPSL